MEVKKRRTALVCDDSRDICQFLFEILENEGFTVSFVRNGEETYKVLSGYSGYDVAFVDIVMPKDYGTSAVSLANSFGNHTPIVFMSGLAVLEQDEINNYPFLEKPFTREDILHVIEEIETMSK